MPKNNDILHSMLIVSASDQFDSIIKRSISKGSFSTVEFRKSAALARRFVLERYCDIVVINIPLSDETGEELAYFITERSNASVMLAVPQEVYSAANESMSGYGILVISKQDLSERADQAISFMSAYQDRIRTLEQKIVKAEEKLEEMRLINKAKFLLVETKNMTEDDAHRFIGKCAMDRGVSRAHIARMILDDME